MNTDDGLSESMVLPHSILAKTAVAVSYAAGMTSKQRTEPILLIEEFSRRQHPELPTL
ncbi:hypothetical protein KEM60_00257 [Austwickia sp. TVS 96-490-7B]|nr:hypothetical protein [Austwickia sp. TVS 96-490-7B]